MGRRFPPEVNYVFQRDQLQSFDHLSASCSQVNTSPAWKIPKGF